jgi:hypothetical protein
VQKIKPLMQFKKDYRREQSGRSAKALDGELDDTLELVRLGSRSELGW